MTEGPTPPDAAEDRGDAPSALRLALVLLGFALVALVVYGPALSGPFVSDDIGVVRGNPYVQSLDLENLVAILDPRGVPAAYTANYAPVHLLLHALEWPFFGTDTTGYHVVNVCIHAIAATLLVALLGFWGIPRNAALAGGALFLVHPANVEAVAWIFQLKTVTALALALGALLWLPRRPLAAAVLFALAMLTKVVAIFALPAAAAWLWVRARRDGKPPVAWTWLLVWVAVMALVAVPEWLAFERLGHSGRPLDPDPFVAARTVFAMAARYLVMAASSFGVSAFHDPERARSALDPWWLLGLALFALLGWRTLVGLARGRIEAPFWIWAAAAWLPISQIFPLLYPMADRYLYFVLPGLLGGVLAIGGRWLDPARGELRARIAFALLGALALGFAVHAHQRARLWSSEARLLADAATNYPNGIEANLLRASAAAQLGDLPAVIVAVRAAGDRGFDRFEMLERHPAFAGVRNEPAFHEVVVEVAKRWMDSVLERQRLNQAELHVLGRAHLVRDEYALAVRRLEEAIALGGPWQESVRASLEEARTAARRAEARRVPSQRDVREPSLRGVREPDAR